MNAIPKLRPRGRPSVVPTHIQEIIDGSLLGHEIAGPIEPVARKSLINLIKHHAKKKGILISAQSTETDGLWVTRKLESDGVPE